MRADGRREMEKCETYVVHGFDFDLESVHMVFASAREEQAYAHHLWQHGTLLHFSWTRAYPT